MPGNGEHFEPRWFGDYELLRPLGVGGMAEVYLARTVRSQGFQKIVVVKRLLPHLARDPHYTKMFIQEATLTVQLQHANIVQIYSLDEHAGQPFIAMEHVHGKDLLRVIKRARERRVELPIEFCVHCLAEMLKGLGYAHGATGSRGPLHLVHRDVTPSNIFISFEGEVKLGDFGVAHPVSSSQAKRVLGKFSYLAPEVIEGEPADARSDIYSAGVVLWETLAQRPLFPGGNEAAVVRQILDQQPAPPSTHNPRVARDLDLIAAKALARKPEQRFATARAFEEALADYLFTRRLRWTRQHVAGVISALFPADCKPLDLPPPLPRTAASAAIDLTAFRDVAAVLPITVSLAAKQLPPPTSELSPPPATDFSEITPWTESIELRLDDLDIDDTVRVEMTFDGDDADRFYVSRRGRAEPTPATIDQLIDLLASDVDDITAVSLFGGPKIELRSLARMLYWDTLSGLVEPDTEPAVARPFDEVGVVQLLYQASMRRISGLLVLERESTQQRRFVYLDQGVPQYIASDDPRDGVLPVMREHGLLSSQHLGDIVERVLTEQISLDWALMSSALREDSEKVEQVFSATIRVRLFGAFGWRRGVFRLFPDAAPPVVLTVRLPPLVDMLVDAVSSAISVADLRDRLRPHDQKKVVLPPAHLPHLAALKLKNEERSVVDQIDGARTTAVIIERCTAQTADAGATALAVLYVLAETRVIQFA